MQIVVQAFQKTSEGTIEVIHNIKMHRYKEARIGLNMNGYGSFTADIFRLRRQGKSLLSGLIKTSSVTNTSDIEAYKREWIIYDVSDNNINSYNYHHHLIYQRFKQVKTLEELNQFNDFFNKYIVGIFFNLIGILIRRMRFTIEFLKTDVAFENICRDGLISLGMVMEDLNKLNIKTE